MLWAAQVNTIANKPLPDIYFISISNWLAIPFSFAPRGVLLAVYLQMSAFRRYAHDQRTLQQQLRSFSVRDAHCSDSEDRKTIEQTILTWFDTDDLEVGCVRPATYTWMLGVQSEDQGDDWRQRASLGPGTALPHGHVIAPPATTSLQQRSSLEFRG